MKRCRFLAGAALPVLSLAQALVFEAAAQEPAGAPAPAASDYLGDIIVTAQKRKVDLQDVPLSISVFSNPNGPDATGSATLRHVQPLAYGYTMGRPRTFGARSSFRY